MRLGINIILRAIKTKKRFRLEVSPFCLEFDRDYGIDHRTGWSYIHRGSVVEDINPSLIATLWKAVCYHWDRIIHPGDWE